MDVNQSTLIIIQTDDEDDDVVYIKEEKAPVQAEKRDEDDVIFLSEEQAQPSQNTPARLKKKSKGEGSSSKALSSEDEDDNFALPQFHNHPPEYATISVEQDILKPLDFSQESPQPPTASLVECQALSPQKLFQGPPCSVTMPEHLSKGSMDLGTNPSKIQDNFFSTGKGLTDIALTLPSSKSQRCSLLKLPEKSQSGVTQTLNTPVCKVVHWPGGTPESIDHSLVTSASKEVDTSDRNAISDKQQTDVPESNKLSMVGASVDSSGQGKSLHNTVVSLLSSTQDLTSIDTTFVDSSFALSASPGMLKNSPPQRKYNSSTSSTCAADGNSRLPALNSSQQLDTDQNLLKDNLHIPQFNKGMCTDKNNPPKLQFDSINSDELSRMLDFLCPDSRPETDMSPSAPDLSSQKSEVPGGSTPVEQAKPQVETSVSHPGAKLSYVSGDKVPSDSKTSSPHSASLSSARTHDGKASRRSLLNSCLKSPYYRRPQNRVHKHSKTLAAISNHHSSLKKRKLFQSQDSVDNLKGINRNSVFGRAADRKRKKVKTSHDFKLSSSEICKKTNMEKIQQPIVAKAEILEAPSAADPGNPRLKMKLKLYPSKADSALAPPSGSISSFNRESKKTCEKLKRQRSLVSMPTSEVKEIHMGIQRSISENCGAKDGCTATQMDVLILCVTCKQRVCSSKLSKCGSGHGVCVTCLEVQVKAILSGDVKPKNIKCPASTCVDILSFEELKQTLPTFVVDILEEKLDKEYLSYITKWMFTDEQIKSRSEFATSDVKTPLCPALKMRRYEEVYTLESRDPTEDLPTFWTPMERGAPVMVYEVVPETEEYTTLALQFHDTMRFPDYDIVRIIRVQNPILWKYFALKRSEMVQDNEGMDVIEKQLYHGTHRSTLEAIARKGFDWRLSGKHGTVYGCGSYFAKNAKYSHGYTDCAGSGVSVKNTLLTQRSSITDPTLTSIPRLFVQAQDLRTAGRLASHRFTQTILGPIPGLPLAVASQNLQLQPPPAHFHLPPPPPAHGQMSSLQVQAHNKIACSAPAMTNPAAAISSSSLTPSNPATTSKYLAPHKPSLVPPLPLQAMAPHHYPSSCVKRFPSGPVPLSSGNLFSSNNQAPSSAKLPVAPASGNSTQPPGTLSYDFVGGASSRCGVDAGPAGIPQSISDALQWAVSGCSKTNASRPGCSSDNITGGSNNNLSRKDDRELSTSFQNESSSSNSSRAQERGTSDLTGAFARGSDVETHCMFVARVLVGRHTGGKAGLKRPPPLDDKNPFGKSYDSCVDNIWEPQVYVIFDSHQAYPEYVIEYTWNRQQLQEL